MIGRIGYGESCQGMLNYVFRKEGMRILGYGNMCSEEISQKFFGDVLHFQGQRNATKNRYAHITLNLPFGEHLSDADFHQLSQDYMHQMGYGEQPYVVVRHTDTKHEHVHIISTNVNEEGKVLNIFNSHKRNMATQDYLESKFGLSPAPSTKQQKELPIYRLPEQFGMDDTQGTRFYIQDVLNSMLLKHKVRSLGELSKLVAPYHITIKQSKNITGRIGVAYGLNNKKGYQTRFINGSTVHRKLSGPKLQKVFDINSKSNLLPMHRKRLLKQIETTYKLFKTIRPNDLTDILKTYQEINIKLERKSDVIKGFTVIDKSHYVFNERELGKHICVENRLDIFGSDNSTEIDTDSKQFTLEVQKLIKEAIYEMYLQTSKKGGLLSENILNKRLPDILPNITASKNYIFLTRYLPENKKEVVLEMLKREFPEVQVKMHQRETKKEKEILQGKCQLIGNVLEKEMFDVGTANGSLHLLFQALGVKYQNNKLSFSTSNKHSVHVPLGSLPHPKTMEDNISAGFVRQNQVVLEMLTQQQFTSTKVTSAAIFLPMIFPKLYSGMNPVYKEQYENAAISAYIKHAERVHASYEKSPKDYIDFFNAKGFYFVKEKDSFKIKSIYTDNNTSCTLPKRTCQYLKSIANWNATLTKQQLVINDLVKYNKNNLKNLWAGHLMEQGMYNKTAFMILTENVYPNLHPELLQYHMDNGLRKSLEALLKRQSNFEQNRSLRKGVYAINALLGDRNQANEVYNGFKDELTDYSKKSFGLSF